MPRTVLFSLLALLLLQLPATAQSEPDPPRLEERYRQIFDERRPEARVRTLEEQPARALDEQHISPSELQEKLRADRLPERRRERDRLVYAEGRRDAAREHAETTRRRSESLAIPTWYRAAADAAAGLSKNGPASQISVNTLDGGNDGACGADGADALADCSLLEAVALANATPGMDVIGFSVAGTIPITETVVITSPIRLDGRTAPGGAHQVRIDASNAFEAIVVTGASASNTVIEGLVIGNAPFEGVVIAEGFDGSPTGVRLLGNTIGTDPDGNDLGNGGSGVLIVFAAQNAVGGAAPGEGNIIGHNGDAGVGIVGNPATRNVVQGNFIGTDAEGNNLGNDGSGVLINSGSDNTVGGITPGAGNTIGHNGVRGVLIEMAPNTVVQGNTIGTDAQGRDLGNASTGVFIQDASNTRIGGIAAGAGNTIGHNGGSGVIVLGLFEETTGNVVQGNTIGTDAQGRDLGNALNGVAIVSASANSVGGTASRAGNTIGHNGTIGVYVREAPNTVVQGNTIGTDAQGRDLGNGDGVVIESVSDTKIGGTTPGAGNTIGHNARFGVAIADFSGAAAGNLIQGNTIGTDAQGRNLGNGSMGVYIQDASYNTIGGVKAGAGNTIGNSGNRGVLVRDWNFVGTTGNVIQGNYVGTDAQGRDLGNEVIGIGIWSSGNTVGGSIPGAGNTVGFNVAMGIRILWASGNVVQGNYVGTDAQGRDLGNRGDGIELQRGADNVVGGTAPGEGNTIGHNEWAGITLYVETGAVIQGNTIGTDARGRDLGNGGAGIMVDGSSGNLVGGTAPGAGNTIGHNDFDGITVFSFVSDVTSNRIQGNLIGTDAQGRDLGNGGFGVALVGQPDNMVGGVEPGAGNTIAYNVGSGVLVFPFLEPATGNAVLGNAIYANELLGIDLVVDPPDLELGLVTPNDGCGDADAGPNGLQNFPVLTSATRHGATVAVAFDLDTAPGAYRVEFFAVDTPEPSGHGEGRTFLGAETVAVEPGCAGEFDATLTTTPPPNGGYVTATATLIDAGQPSGFGGTSEFSAAVDLVIQGGEPSAPAAASPSESPAGKTTAETVETYALAGPYPNPFNPSTTIRFDLPEAATVRLVVYDLMGREVGRLVDEPKAAGQHRVVFDAAHLAGGAYLVHMTTDTGFTQTQRVVLMK